MNKEALQTKHIGKIIRQRRKEKGLSLEKTAELCNLSTRGLEKIELGDSDPKWSNVIKLVGILDIDIEALSVCVDYPISQMRL